MSKLVLLFVCVAVFNLANALQCYHCEKEQCEKDSSMWQKTVCANSAEQKLTNACVKHTFKDATSHKEMYIRKCIYVDKVTKKPLCDATKGELVACEACETDLCNTAPRVSLSLAAICGVVLALFLPKIFA